MLLKVRRRNGPTLIGAFRRNSTQGQSLKKPFVCKCVQIMATEQGAGSLLQSTALTRSYWVAPRNPTQWSASTSSDATVHSMGSLLQSTAGAHHARLAAEILDAAMERITPSSYSAARTETWFSDLKREVIEQLSIMLQAWQTEDERNESIVRSWTAWRSALRTVKSKYELIERDSEEWITRPDDKLIECALNCIESLHDLEQRVLWWKCHDVHVRCQLQIVEKWKHRMALAILLNANNGWIDKWERLFLRALLRTSSRDICWAACA